MSDVEGDYGWGEHEDFSKLPKENPKQTKTPEVKEYVVETISRQRGRTTDFFPIKTRCGMQFNLFDEVGANLVPGMKFKCALKKKGDYWNVVEGTLEVDMSQPIPKNVKQNFGDNISDRAKQESIESQNALTGLVSLLCNDEVWEHCGYERGTITHNVMKKLLERADIKLED